MADSVVDEHREEIVAPADRHSASNVRLFGSIARGQGGPESDVDLLVSFEPGRSLLDLIGLKHEIEDLVNRPVDVVTDRALSPYIRDQVLAEAVPL